MKIRHRNRIRRPTPHQVHARWMRRALSVMSVK